MTHIYENLGLLSLSLALSALHFCNQRCMKPAFLSHFLPASIWTLRDLASAIIRRHQSLRSPHLMLLRGHAFFPGFLLPFPLTLLVAYVPPFVL